MNCKNCHTALTPESDYCNSCGGKIIRQRLTIRNLFEHLSETFFNYDNKLLRTTIDLFKKPEVVIGGYIDGVRKKYVNPVSLFGLALTISGIYILILNKFFPEAMDFSAFTLEGQEEMQKRNMSFVQEYQSVFMMLYVPLYALMARLAFIGIKKYNYTELLVVFIYIQAQISIVASISIILVAFLGVKHGIISMVLIPLMILYSAYCLKRLYNLSLSSIILRTLFFLVILFVVFFLLGIIMAIIMYLNGDFQLMVEAQRAAQG